MKTKTGAVLLGLFAIMSLLCGIILYLVQPPCIEWTEVLTQIGKELVCIR